MIMMMIAIMNKMIDLLMIIFVDDRLHQSLLQTQRSIRTPNS